MKPSTDLRARLLKNCRETFSQCMRAAVHCTNDLQIPANDSCVVALMDCADACYASLGFSQENSAAQREAMHFASNRCAEVAQVCDSINDPLITACVEQCQRCAGLIRESLGTPALSMAV